MSLLQRIGGQDVLLEAVELFYKRVIIDERVMPFFQGIDVIRLVKHQYNFLKQAFSPPNAKSEEMLIKRMQMAHARLVRDLGLNYTHYDVMIEHFRQTCVHNMHIREDLVDEACVVMQRYRPLFPGGGDHPPGTPLICSDQA